VTGPGLGTYLPRGMFRSRALLDCARDLPCGNCGTEDGTVVAAHSNLGEHGKGKGLKAHDCFFAALCAACHFWLDNQGGSGKDPTAIYLGNQDGKREMFIRAMHRTWLELWRRKLVRAA
jgi:hypothetical protein